MKKINYLILIFWISFSVFAQTQEEKDWITSHYDSEKSEQLIEQLENQNTLRENRVEIFLQNNPEYERYKLLDNHKMTFLKDVTTDGIEITQETHNTNSATSISVDRINAGGSLGLDLDGDGMTVGVWEVGGTARLTHQEFNGRVINRDSNPFILNSFHATHVTGTIASAGTGLLTAKGLASKTGISAYDATDDYTEMADEASNGLLVSNHSYGLRDDFLVDNGLYQFYGGYGSDANNVDQICHTYPFYIPVLSAGNSRNDGIENDGPGESDNGYDLLNGDKVAKNAMVVAAVNDVLTYTGSGSVVMSSFSSWGPTDDGRIKPDISSNGVSLISTGNGSDTDYGSISGTSMAAPGIAALLILLQEHNNNVNSAFLKSASVKGLVLHTARETGNNQGPDYEFGWGLADAEAAVNLISNTTDALIDEKSLSNGDNYVAQIEATGGVPLIVSISWTDPEGPVLITTSSGTVDDRTPVLVNDLDLVLERNGTNYYPWKLDPEQPANAATRTSTNDVDNFEKVEVDAPVAGEIYNFTVSHKGTLMDPQDYTLIISGGELMNLSTVDFERNNKEVVIFPNPTTDFINIRTKDSTEDVEKVTIFDTTGKTVFTSNESNNYNVQSLPSGLYIVEIKTSKGTYQEKFLKK